MFGSFFFSVLLQDLGTYLFLLSFSFTLWSVETAKSTFLQVPYFFISIFWSIQVLVVWPRLTDPFTSQNHGGICTSHSPGQIVHISFVHMVKL